MDSLLFEIGTEEIPAGYIGPALAALESMLKNKMKNARIDHGLAKTFGTPRRLSVLIENVAPRQRTLTTEIMGPPQKVGFDANNRPTVAAEKFAEKVRIPIKKIKIKETKKGPYLCATVTERGLASKNILKNILPEVILSIPFPKTMRWENLENSFARPIQTILALLGKNVIAFEFGNLKSGRQILGHRFIHPGRIQVTEPEQYVEILKTAGVVVDIEQRKEMIVSGIDKISESLGGRVLPDEDLVDIVTNLVEYPAVSSGRFDTGFLELPEEVLITSMREHQKYFAVVDKNNKLMPNFIVVNNTPARDMALVSRGHERVLMARLEDARFFYNSDMKETLDNLVGKLKKVLFQASLGSVYEKVNRIQMLAEYLAEKVDTETNLKNHVSRAAWLCKADLVSQVVVEFPKLQGVMGRIYAEKKKEPGPVAAAIEEHYWPTFSGGPLPVTTPGAILAIADKIDSICGCFSAGFIPTGASDPYALRRQGIGIIQIMLDKGFDFSLTGLIEKSTALFNADGEIRIKEISQKIDAFLKSRMSYLLVEEGFSKDVISSVISIPADNLPDIREKVRGLEKMKTEPDFEPLAVAFKRVVNIIKKAGGFERKNVDVSMFEDASESALFTAFGEVKKEVAADLKTGDFGRVLLNIASLREPVDAFFDGVMIMAEDEKLRENRLALLGSISDLFGVFADFSKLSA